MRPVSVYLVTFNCARTFIDVDNFARHFFLRHTFSYPWPDLILLSLQEIAPIAHSFLGGNLLFPYFRRFHIAINKASQRQYEPIATHNVGMTALIVLARSDFSPRVRLAATAGVGVGDLGLGNKGAVGVRLAIGQDDDWAYLTFVAAHLAPMEWAVTRRNEDWKQIVRNLIFRSTHGSKRAITGEAQPLLSNDLDEFGREDGTTMFVPHSLLFFAGDLNYRTSDVPPKAYAHQSFPQPGEESHNRLKSKEMTSFWKADQLNQQRQANATMHLLDEFPVTFAPTYKYADGQRDLWPANGGEPQAYPWAKHRFPSWCDRILFSWQLKRSDDLLYSWVYNALPWQPTSDHRPVALYANLNIAALNTNPEILGDVKPPFDINPDWKTNRVNARRIEVIVGSLAYLGLTWEGNVLLLATVVGGFGGWYLLRSLIET